ncbi:BLUF domain-containing protein [Sphingomonas hengshuiensis]|uniref:BLUF domain-containing protein n=1 Tax=Sphingomonas hengshuiensis TaxID=1609977 RepID=UPI0005C82501|nr:BLUF domain-containing protein [Sphingomonas hengshuiensis]
MLQILYVSTANPALGPVDPGPILEVSRLWNEGDGITGLLYSDGMRFLQVLEGPQAETAACMARIRRDRRHKAVVELSRRAIEERQFGDWAMAHRGPGDEAETFIARVDAMVAGASLGVRATFEGFVRERMRSGRVRRQAARA